ncbi:MAG: hypothetical protein WCT36_03595, partial [Candidatus Gracilibacteria bacterium]
MEKRAISTAIDLFKEGPSELATQKRCSIALQAIKEAELRLRKPIMHPYIKTYRDAMQEAIDAGETASIEQLKWAEINFIHGLVPYLKKSVEVERPETFEGQAYSHEFREILHSLTTPFAIRYFKALKKYLETYKDKKDQEFHRNNVRKAHQDLLQIASLFLKEDKMPLHDALQHNWRDIRPDLDQYSRLIDWDRVKGESGFYNLFPELRTYKFMAVVRNPPNAGVMEKAYFLGSGSHDGLDPLDIFSLLGEMEIGIYFPKWGAEYQAGFEQELEKPSRDLVFVEFDRDAKRKIP